MHSRHNLAGIIFLLYALPLMLMSAYGAWVSPGPHRWSILAIGLLLSSVGTLLFFYIMNNSPEEPQSYSEEAKAPAIAADEELEVEEIEPQSGENEDDIINKEEFVSLKQALEEAQNKEEELLEEITYRNEELQKLTQEKEHAEHERQHVEEEFAKYRQLSQDILAEEKSKANEYEETISELRATVEQKQSQIEHLDNKIRDLTYEIKTLLQLADMGSSSLTSTSEEHSNKQGFAVYESATEYQVPFDNTYDDEEEHSSVSVTIHTKEEAKRQLKRCIDIAQKITGSHHFGSGNSRFGDLTLDNYALDLRRLCDSLRSETAGTVFVYSCKDNKLLFANNQIKQLLGYSPEKFVQDFDHIVQDGIFEWKSSISQLNTMSFSNTRLVMKAKSGHDHLLHCQLGLIPTGVFRNNVIGVLYQD